MTKISFFDLLTKSSPYETKVINIMRDLVQFPSVAYREPKGIRDCANYLEEIFRSFGYQARQYPTLGDKPPIVYAEKNVNARTMLMFYHHYDVQPEDPLDRWISSPWELTERDGRLYGRGTADDKGELTMSLIAMQLLEDQLGELPVNVKFIVEGEEEAGSDHLPHFTKKHSTLLKADGCIWEGAGLYPQEGDVFALATPVGITCGLKGDAYYDLKAAGTPQFPRTDVHSGLAGAVPSATWRLVWALSTLKDKHENILIDGFNELVQPPLEEDIQALEAYEGELETLFKRDYELDKLLLDREGLDLHVTLLLEPALSICGLKSGYQDTGSKTIVPAEALAKLDIRLVPNLTVEKVTQLLNNHLTKHGFSDLKVELLTGYDPGKTPVSHPFIKTVQEATKEIVAPTPVNILPMSAGSGPAYLFAPYTPFCMPMNYVEGLNGHAPNENMPRNGIQPSLAYNAVIAQLVADLLH